MSRNVSQLSGRKGLSENLFEKLVSIGPVGGDTAVQDYKDLAKEFLIGEAVTYGAASFYDLLSGENAGKKALVCNGSACLCAGTQDDVRERLSEHMDPSEIGHITCLGRCHENSAFHVNGRNFSGSAIGDLGNIVKNGSISSDDPYHVESLLDPPLLTGTFPGIYEFYQALGDVVLNTPPEELLEHIKTSNLRGRGGAGFPTGFKWEACRSAEGDKKYIVCNADEGDPGAYIDRYLMEQQPHRVLFGMLVAGYIVGADEGVLYIRAEYPESVETVAAAVAELEAAGFAGANIGGSDFSFAFKIITGAGAYICGEETALLASIEGRRPEVNIRPPYPTTEGLYGKPTVVNNVETFASVHYILTEGGAAFAEIGTEKSTGTKLVCLDGLFNRPGLYEVPMGTPLSEVVDTLGQGFRRPVKALQVGGPLGGIVPVDKIPELTVDFESFNDAGFLLGHGSIVCIPEEFPMIVYLEHLFEFCAAESCGKCFPCRLGATRGQEMVSAAIHDGTKMDRELLVDLLETMQSGSLCAHGGGIPLPIRNALMYFNDELSPHFQN